MYLNIYVFIDYLLSTYVFELKISSAEDSCHQVLWMVHGKNEGRAVSPHLFL